MKEGKGMPMYGGKQKMKSPAPKRVKNNMQCKKCKTSDARNTRKD